MTSRYYRRLSLLVLATFLLTAPVAASIVVRMHLSTGASPDPGNPQPYDAFSALGGNAYIDLELFDDIAPRSVDNFLSYVDDGAGTRRYDGTFFHRLVPSTDQPLDGLSILQGGGFIYEPEVGPFSDFFNSGVRHIIEDDYSTIRFNEVAQPNVRGTVAMAKSAGKPDTPTSEWFINLTDNSAVLDDPANNGGFAVFGQVLGTGMSAVVDLLDKNTEVDGDYLPTFSFGLPPLPDLPLVDFPPGPVQLSQLLMLDSVTKILSLDNSAANTDFDLVPIDVSTTSAITITNLRADILIIDQIGATDGLSAPFQLLPSGCTAGMELASGESCNISLSFLPTADGQYSDTFDLSFRNTDLSPLSVRVNGRPAPQTPQISVTPTSVNFGSVGTGLSGIRALTIENIGGSAGEFLSITSIALAGVNPDEFDVPVASNQCTGRNLAFRETCTFDVHFLPSTESDKSALVVIEHSAGAASEIPLGGSGFLLHPVIRVGDMVDFGHAAVNQTNTAQLLIQNGGSDPLQFSSFTISGDFSFVDTEGCPSAEPLVELQICRVILEVTPTTIGETLTGTLTINSNDPDNPSVVVQLTAIGMGDVDGIDDAVENAGPNNGDSNGDGVLDSIQDHVSSLQNPNGTFTTLATAPGLRLRNVALIDNPSPHNTPSAQGATIRFDQGFYRFSIEGLEPGASTTVTMYFPQDFKPNTYFKYGKLPGSTFARWYQFDYNGSIGARFSGNRVTLHLIDGGPGDDDLSPNGRIVDPGAPAVATVTGGSSSGGGGGCVMSSTNSRATGTPLSIDLVAILLGLLTLFRLRRANASHR